MNKAAFDVVANHVVNHLTTMIYGASQTIQRKMNYNEIWIILQRFFQVEGMTHLLLDASIKMEAVLKRNVNRVQFALEAKNILDQVYIEFMNSRF